MSKLRKIRFRKLKEVEVEVQSLLESGYRQGGEWSLGEICDHLSKSLRAARVGISTYIPSFMQYGMYSFAGTMAQVTRGMQVPTLIPPTEEISDQKGVNKLVKELKKYRKQRKRAGRMFLGSTAAKRGRKFQLWHCGHHLSFLEPRDAASRNRPDPLVFRVASGHCQAVGSSETVAES